MEMPVKCVLLAGGLGTRISEETLVKPKPMIEIGSRPIIWHIMKLYAEHGVNEFIVCCGYKGYLLKEFFANYFLHTSDVTFDMSTNSMTVHHQRTEPWRVTLVDTGLETMTAGRLRRVASYLAPDDEFCLTYGDGLSNIDINNQLRFHRSHGKWATVAAVQPPGRYGALKTHGNIVTGFSEKPLGDGGAINGGFFVFSRRCVDLIDGDTASLEGHILPKLAELGQLMSFPHSGFWHAMDTLRDKTFLEDLWEAGKAPWKVWP
jgi:glucose-1-phosphate cytidylyltransferase